MTGDLTKGDQDTNPGEMRAEVGPCVRKPRDDRTLPGAGGSWQTLLQNLQEGPAL